MATTIAVHPYVRDDSDTRPQVIFTIDRSPVDVAQNPDGTLSVKDATGGAGKVVAGDAAALLREGYDVHVVAVAKTRFQRELAKQNRPVLYDYNGQIITYHFADVDPDIYKEARDGAFSEGAWYDQQEQDHPDIRPNTTRRQIDCYELANRAVAEKVNRIARPGARIWNHDTHVGRVAKELKETFHRDDVDSGYVHHAAMHFRSYLQRHFPNVEEILALPLDHPKRCHYDLIKSVVDGFAAHDVVNFSSGGESLDAFDGDGDLGTDADRGQDPHFGWALAGEESFAFFGYSPEQQPFISAVPVPLDAAYVVARSMSPAVERVRRDLVRDLRGRKLVITGGRAEPYKNLPEFIFAEKLRYRLTAPAKGYSKQRLPGEMSALLTSPTRHHIPFYDQHFRVEVKEEARQANHALNMELNKEYAAAYRRHRAIAGTHKNWTKKMRERAQAKTIEHVMQTHGVEFFRMVDGSKYENTLAYQIEADVDVTLARREGYNLMAIEQPVVQAAARQRGVTNKVCVHVMNVEMGLFHHYSTLDRKGVVRFAPKTPWQTVRAQQAMDEARARTPAALPVTARIVRLSNDPAQQAREIALRDGETMSIATTTQSALRMPLRERLRMFNELLRIPVQHTPSAHMKLLGIAAEKAIKTKCSRISSSVEKVDDLTAADRNYLKRHGKMSLVGRPEGASKGEREKSPQQEAPAHVEEPLFELDLAEVTPYDAARRVSVHSITQLEDPGASFEREGRGHLMLL